MSTQQIIRQFQHTQGKVISTDSVEIYFEDIGEKSDFPIVFLHGGFGTIQDFNPILDKIKGDFRFIGIDSRGHGRSTLGGNQLTYELIVSDIEFVLNHLNISHCSIVGFSDGGICAYHLAIKNPQLVKKIVTIGSDWNPPHRDLEARFKTITPSSWQQRFPKSVDLYNQLNPQANFDNLLRSVLTMWVNPDGYPKENVKDIKSEILIIRGDEDHLMPRTCFQSMMSDFPTVKFLNIPFAGHCAHEDQSEIVANIINQFLK